MSLPRFDSSILTATEYKEYQKLLKTYNKYKTQLEIEFEKLTDCGKDTTLIAQRKKNIEVKQGRLSRAIRDIDAAETQIQKIREESEKRIKYLEMNISRLRETIEPLETAIETESQQLEEWKTNPRSPATIAYEKYMKDVLKDINKIVSRYISVAPPAPPPAPPAPSTVQEEESDEDSDSSSEYSLPEETPLICKAEEVTPVEPEPVLPESVPQPLPVIRKTIKTGKPVEPPPQKEESQSPPLTQMTGERAAYYKWCVAEEGCVAGSDDLQNFIDRKKMKNISIPKEYLQQQQQPPSYFYTPPPQEYQQPRIIATTKKLPKQITA